MKKWIIGISIGLLFIALSAMFYIIEQHNISDDPVDEFADLQVDDEANLFTVEQDENGILHFERYNGPFSSVSYDEESDEICIMSAILIDFSSSELSKNGVLLSREEMINVLASTVQGDLVLNGVRTSVDEKRIQYTRFEIDGEYTGYFTLFANHGKTICRVPASMTNLESLNNGKSKKFNLELLALSVFRSAAASLALLFVLTEVNILRKNRERNVAFRVVSIIVCVLLVGCLLKISFDYRLSNHICVVIRDFFHA